MRWRYDGLRNGLARKTGWHLTWYQGDRQFEQGQLSAFRKLSGQPKSFAPQVPIAPLVSKQWTVIHPNFDAGISFRSTAVLRRQLGSCSSASRMSAVVPYRTCPRTRSNAID